jgi:hypothetical protein
MVWAAELIGPGGPCAFPHGRWLWGCQNLVAPSGRPANTRSKFSTSTCRLKALATSRMAVSGAKLWSAFRHRYDILEWSSWLFRIPVCDEDRPEQRRKCAREADRLATLLRGVERFAARPEPWCMPDAWSRVPPYLARRAKTHRTLHWPVGAPVGTGMNHPFSSAQRAKREKSGCFKASIIAYGPAVPPPSMLLPGQLCETARKKLCQIIHKLTPIARAERRIWSHTMSDTQSA